MFVIVSFSIPKTHSPGSVTWYYLEMCKNTLRNNRYLGLSCFKCKYTSFYVEVQVKLHENEKVAHKGD